MLTAEHNRLLTEVEGNAPMGQLMRHRHWIPCALSETLVANGQPKLVRLLGDRYVAFRATDGRIGFFEEACPHRGASLTLARNEDCALRCIFHAWKFNVLGEVVEVPSEGARSAQFAVSVKLRHYPTFEGGGVLWVFLGQGEPPPRPPLPFLDLAPGYVWVSRSLAPCNWLQGVEGTIDSLHVGILHQSWIAGQLGAQKGSLGLTLANHPRYEVEDTAYGLRAAALRDLPDGRQYVRVTEYVLPFISLVPGSRSSRTGSLFMAVPMGNTSHMLFWGLWDEDGSAAYMASERALRSAPRDVDNYAQIVVDADGNWRQNRGAMAGGHFSGFDGALLDEDVVVQASMGAVVDRSKEHLCASDVGLARARQRLTQELLAAERDERPSWGSDPVRPLEMLAEAGFSWRTARMAERQLEGV